jgi:hypothetical protein
MWELIDILYREFCRARLMEMWNYELHHGAKPSSPNERRSDWMTLPRFGKLPNFAALKILAHG